jgi:hypothetical protein
MAFDKTDRPPRKGNLRRARKPDDARSDNDDINLFHRFLGYYIPIGSTRFYGVLRGSARFCGVLRGSAGFYEVLQGSVLHGSARFREVRFCEVLLGSARRCGARRGTQNPEELCSTPQNRTP